MRHSMTKLAPIVDEIISREILKTIKITKENTNEYEICFSILVALDIFRALRKYVFPKAKHVRKELPHLLNPKELPSHYPKCLKTKELTSRAKGNLAYMTEAQILEFNSRCSNLTGKRDRETWVYSNSRLLISNQAFNQLTKVQSVESLSLIFATMFSKDARLSQPGGVQIIAEQVVHHNSTTLETSCLMHAISMKIRELPNWCVNSVLFVGFVHKQIKGAKRALLLDGELSCKLVASEFIGSFSDKPVKLSSLNTLLMCGVYKRMINHFTGSASSNSRGPAVFRAQNDLDYHYYLKPTSKQHYVLKTQLDENYIVSNSTGHYRLDKVAKCPIQFIDLVDEAFSAVNYVRKLAAPLETQSFLETFDGNALVKILESIPGFVYTFSEQQRDLIASHHNCVVVGRSGTGKTTCAVMRMIGIRLLEIADRNAKKGIKKIRYEDLCQSNLTDDHRNLH